MGKNTYRDLKEAIENPKLHPIGVSGYDAGRERARQMIDGYTSMWDAIGIDAKVVTTANQDNITPTLSLEGLSEAMENLNNRGLGNTVSRKTSRKPEPTDSIDKDDLDMDKIKAEAIEAEFSIIDDRIEDTPENDGGYHHTIMGIDVGSGGVGKLWDS